MFKQKSFTLIELLVVIVIIGILASVIIISTSGSISKASVAKLKAFEAGIQNNLAANMVSAWDADHVDKNGTSSKLIDKWGNGNDGVFHNGSSVACSDEACPQVVKDKTMGNVLSFDGVDDYIDFGSNIPSLLAEASISFWRKQTELKGWLLLRGQSNAEYIMATSGGEGDFYHNNAGGEKIIYKDGLVATSPATDYNWHFYVITDVDLSSWSVLTLNNYSNWRYYDFLDDLRIYNTALSSAQVKQSYIAGLDFLLSKNQISKKEYNQRIKELSFNK